MTKQTFRQMGWGPFRFPGARRHAAEVDDRVSDAMAYWTSNAPQRTQDVERGGRVRRSKAYVRSARTGRRSTNPRPEPAPETGTTQGDLSEASVLAAVREHTRHYLDALDAEDLLKRVHRRSDADPLSLLKPAPGESMPIEVLVAALQSLERAHPGDPMVDYFAAVISKMREEEEVSRRKDAERRIHAARIHTSSDIQ